MTQTRPSTGVRLSNAVVSGSGIRNLSAWQHNIKKSNNAGSHAGLSAWQHKGQIGKNVGSQANNEQQTTNKKKLAY